MASADELVHPVLHRKYLRPGRWRRVFGRFSDDAPAAVPVAAVAVGLTPAGYVATAAMAAAMCDATAAPLEPAWVTCYASC